MYLNTFLEERCPLTILSQTRFFHERRLPTIRELFYCCDVIRHGICFLADDGFHQLAWDRMATEEIASIEVHAYKLEDVLATLGLRKEQQDNVVVLIQHYLEANGLMPGPGLGDKPY